MNRVITLLLVVFVQALLFAQNPKVPSKIILGDMKLKITDGARAEIQKNVDDLVKHPKYFNAKVDLANQYFPFIEEAFKKEGVPESIKYLVIQESGLVSDAVSTSNAVGYWQFKDFTAVEMGLRVDRHVDERKNIVSASIGAAKYLKMNNSYFDNWIYAIQAYQMGAGGALKVTNKKLYGAKQMTITKKTYWYVKKFLAHKIAYESSVGQSKPSVYLSAYRSGAGKSLRDIARKFKVNEDELIKYNKWLKRGQVPSDKNYAVIVPDKQFIKSIDDVDNSSKPKNIIVKKVPSHNQSQSKLFPLIKTWKGSNKYSNSTISINKLPGIKGLSQYKLVELAKKGNISLSDFLSFNDIKIEHKVIDDQVYYFKKKKKKAKVYYHVVRSGETLWSISQKYGLQLKKLLLKNRMVSYAKIKEGRVLWMRHIRPENIPITYEEIDDLQPIKIQPKINVEEKIAVNPKPLGLDSIVIDILDSINEVSIDTAKFRSIIHIVKKGDTYYNIANRYKVSVLDLVKWNKLRLTDKLSIDQKIKILVLKKMQDSIGGTDDNGEVDMEDQLYYVVEKGDTLYSISKKYNISLEVLKNMNDKRGGDIAIGEQLKVSINK